MTEIEIKTDRLLFLCACETTSINLTRNQCNEIKIKLENSNNCEKDVSPLNQTELIFQVILILVVGFFGICGNLGAIHRFSRLKKATKFHHLMMLISTYDCLCISMIVFIFSLPRVSNIYKDSAFYHYFAPTALALTQVALTGSIYTTLAITVERYMIVCHPFYVVSHKWSSKMYVLPIAIFSVLYNVPKFFELYALPCILQKPINITNLKESNYEELEIVSLSNVSSSCFYNSVFETANDRAWKMNKYFILPTSLRLNTSYVSVYAIWMNLIFMGTLPVLTLILLNIQIVKNLVSNLKEKQTSSITQIPKSQQNNNLNTVNTQNSKQDKNKLNSRTKKMKPKEIKLAKVGLYIVLIFVLCHSVRWVPNFYELSHSGKTQPPWVDAFMHISHFVIVLNSSVNFYIYCLTHLNIIGKIRECFGNKATYVRNRCSSISQSTVRRMSTLTSSQSRRTSVLTSGVSNENAHQTKLQSVMEDLTVSVTIPMLSSIQEREESDEESEEEDDEW